MEQSFLYDVFLSHSSKDKAVVRAIAERLRDDGLRVWFDEWVLKPGDHIPAKIEEGLEHSRILVLCMSAHSFGSDWARLEVGTFRFRDPLNKDRRFIPLRLDDSPIKGSLAPFLYIDWFSEHADLQQEYARLLESCWPETPQLRYEEQQPHELLLNDIIFIGHTKSVESVAWSPDGRQILSGSGDTTVRLWEVATGRCERVFEGHTSWVESVAWSPDGRRVLSGSTDQTLRLWEVATGRCERVFEGHRSWVGSVVWSPDGRWVLSGSGDATVRLWEVATGRCERVFEGHTSWVESVAWSPDGRRALSGGGDATVRLWEVATGWCERVFENDMSWVESVAWSPDGRRSLSGSADGRVRLWEVATGRCEQVFEGHTESIRSVVRSSDGRRALTGSEDTTARLWEVATGRCEQVFKGHRKSVESLAWSPDGRWVLSGSGDATVRLWEVTTGRCVRVFEGHTSWVESVAWSPDGRRALSGGGDATVRLWEVATGRCVRVFEGHTNGVGSLAWSPDGRRALSGSADGRVRLWEVATGRCEQVFKGHRKSVESLAWSPDGRQILSGSGDATVRLWEVTTGRCVRVFEGHTNGVGSLAWSPDGRRALTGSEDATARLWEVATGRCERVFKGHTSNVVWSPDGQSIFSTSLSGAMQMWNAASDEIDASSGGVTDQVQYTNAKVLVVGDTHAGKTGLTHRLATGEWKSSESSTVGAWATQWLLKDFQIEHGVDREIWLWDFGGQADQRLVHQLYMDHAALILLLFNADQEDVLPGLRDWETALRRCMKERIPYILVAGRIDAGFKASRGKLQNFAVHQGFTYYETSAKSGEGCDELRKDIINSILWAQIEKRTSPRIFKRIKDEILKLRDEGQVLHTFKELRGILQGRLVGETGFTDETLRTVIGLLDGPGVVKELDYGTYVLLAPEWINAYAQAVIRTLRSQQNDLGVLPLRSIAEGNLIYQSIGRDGSAIEMMRLPPTEERVVLGEMERQLEQRGLCLRQGDKLVFPSHCGRDRPSVQIHPSVFVSYEVKGFLDDIYATLVVRLADSKSFQLKELWRDAADFTTLTGGHHMGVKLTRQSGSEGNIDVYFGSGVTEQEQVIFANYIDGHLRSVCEQVVRLRCYVCPSCYTPKGNPEVLMKRLVEKGQRADTQCDGCETRFPLWDALEQLFASEELRKKVELMADEHNIWLDLRRKSKLLRLEVGARIASADQKCFEIPATEDEGLDMELEFTDDEGRGSGKRLYLQLKSGNSHLIRLQDGRELFRIKKQAWVKQVIQKPYPVMLVVGIFPDEDDRMGRRERVEFTDVRWMDVSSVLKRESKNGEKLVTEIEFAGERLDMTSIHKWRKKALSDEIS